jgi:hypothetical protein
MNQSNQGSPCVSIMFLLVIGAGATALGFWLIDHRQVVPNSGVVLLVLGLVFFGSYTWALFRFLGWRDQNRSTIVTVPSRLDPSDLEGTVYGMIQEREYQVVQSFKDHYGNSFEEGERLRFKQRHFLPYHGGHTVVFEGRALYLQEDENRGILDHFSDYLALIQ